MPKRKFCSNCGRKLPKKFGRTKICKTCRCPTEEQIEELKRRIRRQWGDDLPPSDLEGYGQGPFGGRPVYCPLCRREVVLDEDGDCLYCKQRVKKRAGFEPSGPIPLLLLIRGVLEEGPANIDRLAERLGVKRDTVRQVLESLDGFEQLIDERWILERVELESGV